ncbi:MAG: hypothetical protein P1U74_01875 [Legionellaceae bacterium]|nr:hypothetical protein [Legionellaceae bacterium]
MVRELGEWRVLQRRKYHSSQGSLNSLYFYVNDHKDELLTSQNIRFEHNNHSSRRAYHIHLPIYLENQALAKNRSVFDGYNLVKTYLTVDMFVKSTSSPLSTKFTHAHAVVMFERGSSVIKGRVYFNRYGHIQNVSAKKYPRDEVNSHPGIPELLDENQESLLKVFANTSFNFLDELTEKKSKKYLELFQLSFDLDSQLTSLMRISDKKSKPEMLQLAKELRDLTISISSYDDSLEDPRTIEYEQIIARLSADLVCEEDSVVWENLAVQDEPENEEVQKTLEEIDNDMRADIIIDVQRIIDFALDLRDEYNLQLIQMSVALEDKFIFYIQRVSTDGARDFVAKQKEKLPFPVSVLHYLEHCVLFGNVDGVRLIYPEIARKVNMSELSKKLMSKIFTALDDPIDLIAVADFLFENSSVYRMTITNIFKNNKLGDNETSFGWLLLFFIQDKYECFRMGLRQVGISKQDNCYKTNGRKLSVLDSIICTFHKNPKLKYIQSLLRNGARLNLTFDFPTDTSLATNTLILAIQRQRYNYPELIEDLVNSGQINAETLLYSLAICVGVDYCTSMFFITCDTKKHVYFEERVRCVSTLLNAEEQSTYFVYIPQDKDRTDIANRVLVTNSLLKKVYEILIGQEHKKLQELIHLLSRYANQHSSFNFFTSAQIVYSFMRNPTLMDNEQMLLSFIAISFAHKTSDNPKEQQLEKIDYKNAYDLIASFSGKVQRSIRSKPHARLIERKYLEFYPVVSTNSVFRDNPESKEGHCSSTEPALTRK